MGTQIDQYQARREFEQARRQAELEEWAAKWTRKDNRVLPFAAIRRQLRQKSPLYRGVQEIPLTVVVGSVDRYHDFTREFLPLSDELRDRWVTVNTLAQSTGWPPIETYKVGDVYFVKDGHHRVSVARQLESTTIEAVVWEFPNDVQISPDDTLDDVLIRFSERAFLETTQLHERYSDHQIRFTTPGRYPELLAQIEELRTKLAIIDGNEMPYLDAVDAWYELVYLPTVQVIQESSLLADFPGRTEADLFAWLSKHRDEMRMVYGEYENLGELIQILTEQYKEGSIGRLMRQFRRLLGSDELPPLVGTDDSVDLEAALLVK